MSPRPELGFNPARILIVDDERRNRELLEVMLVPDGFVLLTAASGEEALAMVARQAPDLVLLDVMMPGINGYDVARKLKADVATKHIPIIMITALDDRNARMLALNAGAEEFLTKPVNRAELSVRVRNLLRLKAYGEYYDKYSEMLEGEVESRTADLVERTEQAAVLMEQAALLDLAQDAIIVRDMGGRILFWSRGAEVLYGWPGKEALGSNAHELLRTEFSEPLATIEAALLRQGRWEGEAIQQRRDGTRVIVATRWAVQRNADGAPARVLIINNDITHRKEADSALILLTERLSLATAVAKVGVWDWDLATNALTWDATMFEIYGFPPVAPMDRARWAAAVCPEDLPVVEAALRRAIDDKGQGATEYRILRPDGSVRTIAAAARVILDDPAHVSRVIGVDLDVTERKQAEAAAEQTRKDQMRFKDEFLSHVSHELRSPLTAIKQFTTILAGGMAGELTKEQQEYQQIVVKNVQQLQSMIDDLLEVTRLETGKLNVEPESVSVSDAVTDSFHTLQETAREKGVALSCDLPPDLPSAYADQTRLRQILIILLDNAIKFTPKGGAATLRARLQVRDSQFLLIEVSDTGCGISPEIGERIFERLYQVSERVQGSRKGLGLGLYICKELVTRQGGTIWINRRQQKGCTISFTLPVWSLDNVIAPLLKDNKWPSESIALVIVEARVPDAAPSKDSQKEWAREVRNLLQRCLLPNLDVLLPRISFGAQAERFFVAAFADDKGASVLANRIREQFDRLPHLKEGRTLSVSHTMLPSRSEDTGAPVDKLVSRMASHLEESIQAHLIPGAVYHD